MDEMIKADYREIDANNEELTAIGAEIRSITRNMQMTVIVSVIEIGKRFEFAKAKLGHGNWGQWCKECTGYSLSMAENYIKLYKEYGNEQLSLFGDFTNSQSIANLSMTKLLELTAIPADEREQFVEENDITDNTTVRELQALIKEKEAQNTENAEELENAKNEIARLKEKYESEALKKEEQIRQLSEELERIEEKQEETPDNDDIIAKFQKEAEEKALEKVKAEIDKITKEKQKAEDKAKKLDDKYKKLSEKTDSDTKKITELEESVKREKEKQGELRDIIERMKKESELGSNKDILKLNMIFETAQTSITNLEMALRKVSSDEQYDKLREAIISTLSDAVSNL